MSTAAERGLGVGERAPDFVAPTGSGVETRFYARAGGRPALLVFTRQLSPLTEQLHQQISTRASIHVVVPEGAAIASGKALDLFLDDGVVRAAYRLPDDEAVHAVLLDRNLRVLANLCLSGEERIEAILLTLKQAGAGALQGEADDTAASGSVRTITAQAPVLFVARVLEPALCEHLVDLWSASHIETGVEQTVDAARTEVLSSAAKRRQDHIVHDPVLTRVLTQTIGRRVLPEIRRVFAYPADRFEGFKISCYDASSSGFFDGHRDNLSPATAHRRFAMSLNLNAEFTGGGLRFAEYSDDLYRPAAGEALIFACSMLHEVVPVTEGRRFTLLSFLFDAQSSRQSRRSGGPSGPGAEE